MSTRDNLRYWYDSTFLPWYARWAPLVVSICLLIATYAITSAYLTSRAQEKERAARVVAIKAQLVTSCENANQSREAARSLWDYIIEVSTASNPHSSPEQKRFIADFREYVNDVYAPHDCTNLSKSYPLPSPPKIPAAQRDAKR